MGEESSPAEVCLQTRELLDSLTDPALQWFLREWPTPKETRTITASELPVLHWLAGLHSSASQATRPLTMALERAASSMAWRQSYAEPRVTVDFLQNYGWTELAGLAGPIPSTTMACGFLMLGPHTLYPPHRHEAFEIYVPLAGAAAWQTGDSLWRQQRAGSVIVHASGEVHAMQTTAQPLLALYLWRSSELGQKATLQPRGSE